MLDPFPRLGKDGKANVKFIAAWHCHLGSNSCSSAVQDDEVMMLADGDDVAKLLGEGQSWKLEFACTYILFSWLRFEGPECRDWRAKKYIKVMCIVPTRKAAVHVYRITSIVNSYQSIYHIYQPLQLRLCMPVIWPHLWCGLELQRAKNTSTSCVRSSVGCEAGFDGKVKRMYEDNYEEHEEREMTWNERLDLQQDFHERLGAWDWPRFTVVWRGHQTRKICPLSVGLMKL